MAGLSEEEVDLLTPLPLCPRALEGFRVISVDLASLVAGMKFSGDFEEHVQSMAKEASATPTVLFIDKLHTLIGAGGGDGGMNAANLLKPALARVTFEVRDAKIICKRHHFFLQQFTQMLFISILLQKWLQQQP